MLVILSAHYDDEFIASDTVNRAVVEYPADDPRGVTDEAVPGVMTVVVVDVLETVHVAYRDGERLILPGGDQQIAFLLGFEIGVLALDAGESVAVGLLPRRPEFLVAADLGVYIADADDYVRIINVWHAARLEHDKGGLAAEHDTVFESERAGFRDHVQVIFLRKRRQQTLMIVPMDDPYYVFARQAEEIVSLLFEPEAVVIVVGAVLYKAAAFGVDVVYAEVVGSEGLSYAEI